MELKEIKIIIDLMKKNDLSAFQLEREGFKLKISRGCDAAPGNYVIAAPAPGIAMPMTAAPTPAPTGSGAAPVPPEKEKSNLRDIPSPMVGTYYQAMSPEAPAYVKVGDAVQEDTVVCIIEAMKVMNEIKAETSGVIAEILVDNGKSVQFGQPLFRVRPA